MLVDPAFKTYLYHMHPPLPVFPSSSARGLARATNKRAAQAALIAAAAMLVLGVLMGIKTSLQAAGSSKPFSMEGFEKKGKAGAAGKDGSPLEEEHPRDTKEEDAPNGDWLTDPMYVIWLVGCFFFFSFFL